MPRIVARVVAIAALGLASRTALAQDVVAGGAWLPLPLFQETLANTAKPAGRSYVGVGSGAGLQAFLANDATVFGRSGPVHWVGSDLPLTPTQITDYLTSGSGRLGDPAGHGPLIQIPAAYVSVTVSYKGPVGPVTLTPGQLCRLFSGAVDRWSQLGVAVPPGLDAFKLVYRADGSGATEMLTRHLRLACGAASPIAFRAAGIFADAFKPGLPPSHFVAAQGENGVAATMAGNVSAITYLGPDAEFTAGLKPAWLVNGRDGVAYLPTPANVMAAMESDGQATLPVGGVVVRNPSSTGWSAPDNLGNPGNWVRIVADPAQGYPIVGSTNFILSQCYADPAVAAYVRVFLKRFYDDTARVANHQLTPLPAGMRARLLTAFVNVSGSSAPLAIGHAAVCGDVAGRG